MSKKNGIIAGTVGGILGIMALTGSGTETPKQEPIIEKQEQVVQELEQSVVIEKEAIKSVEEIVEEKKVEITEPVPVVKKEVEPIIVKEILLDKNAPYYTSSHYSAKFYYPKKCNQWEDLSKSYLKSFNTIDALLSSYSRVIHPDC